MLSLLKLFTDLFHSCLTNELTESWATTDISDAELGMTGYVMFRKDRLGRTLMK